MVDVLDAGPIRGKQSDGVMDLVDAEQGRIADPVAHPGVAHCRPESLVARRVGAAETDVAESGNSGVTLSVIAPIAVGGAPDQLDLVARRIFKGDEAPNVAQFSFLRRAQADMMTEPIELGSRRLQFRAIGNFERGGLIGGRTGEVAQCVLALIGFQIN
jgi:hypothetical protein